MDTRQALLSGTILDLPGMHCRIQKEIGRGSNAIVYQASYPDLLHPDETHTVLIKELFPFHPERAIYRAEDGFIVHTEESEEYWQKHQRSFEYGNRIHLRMQRRHPELAGENWNSLSKNGTLYTVLGYTGGRSLAEEMISPETDLRRLAIRMQLLLDVLGDFHAEGYLHLDIAPDNILLIGRGRGERVMLIDYNSVHSAGKRDSQEGAFSMKSGYTAPEIRSGRYNNVCEATDIYSVAAVFFYCLTGAALKESQMIRAFPPDVSDCPALRNRPESVKAIVQQILFRGLQHLPKRRCASVQAMQELMQELIDRIDGVGVTHWALWEAGKKTVTRIIRDNPAFAYIQEDELFPSDTITDNEVRLPTQQFVDGLLSSGGQNTLLSAPGGMGKTTALLRTVWLHTRHYSAGEPAMAYIPLLAYPAEANCFITDRLLENLHFKAETQSYADARRHLRELLDQPLRTRDGERPVLLLLLDGLNEVQGSSEALMKEIKELSALQGVRILITSRSGVAPEGFSGAALSPLSEESVAARLTEKGLLLPESVKMRELLGISLMLSLFLRASLAEEKQLVVQSADDLIKAYFSSLTKKALRDLPEDSPEHWQTKAAVDFVLPAIADALQRKTRLNNEELLRIVKRCYKLFSNRILRRAFPQWIGYSREIRGDTTSAEEWYGLIVHDILWKRLGLLLRTEQDGYQIPHQILSEYLAQRHRENLGRIQKRRLVQIEISTCVVFLFLSMCFGVYWQFIRKKPYDDFLAGQVLDMANLAYADAVAQYDPLSTLLREIVERPDEYQDAFERFENSRSNSLLIGSSVKNTRQDPEKLIKELLETGSYVSWSREPLDKDSFFKLLSLPTERTEDYNRCVQVLKWAVQNRNTRDYYMEYYNDYTDCLRDLLSYDAQITDCLMNQVYFPHKRDDGAFTIYLDNKRRNAHPDVVNSNDITDYDLPELMEFRGEELKKLQSSKAYITVFPESEGSTT